MVQETLRTLWDGLTGLGRAGTGPLLAALLAGAALVGGLLAWGRRGWRPDPALRRVAGSAAAWVGVAALLGAAVWMAGPLARVVQGRLSAAESLARGRGADADAAPTVQAAPSVAYLTERTYTRSLTLPPGLLRRLDTGDLGALTPYLGEPGSGNVTRLADRLRRTAQGVVLTREVTLRAEEPVRLDQSRLGATLEVVSPLWGALRPYYQANFTAQYAFTNPLDRAVTARFTFPLPQGSGTLSDFSLAVDGRELPAASTLRGVWEGRLAAGQRVKVDVHYRHQGARGWSYALGSRRESLRDFSLTLRTNGAPRPARYSLPPTRTSRTLGGVVLAWELKNVITAQDVALTFPVGSGRETVAKLHAFAPAALLLAALFALLWGRPRGLRMAPAGAALALLGLGLGTVLGGVLLSYLPAPVAAPLGALVGAGLALYAVGRAWWPPALLAAGLPLVFLVPGQAGLLLVGVGVVALGALLAGRPGRWRPAAVPAA